MNFYKSLPYLIGGVIGWICSFLLDPLKQYIPYDAVWMIIFILSCGFGMAYINRKIPFSKAYVLIFLMISLIPLGYLAYLTGKIVDLIEKDVEVQQIINKKNIEQIKNLQLEINELKQESILKNLIK